MTTTSPGRDAAGARSTSSSPRPSRSPSASRSWPGMRSPSATTPVFAFLPPAQAILNGLWLLPGSPRRTDRAAARAPHSSAASSPRPCRSCSARSYGGDALISGLVQGAGAELGFALGLYRRWNLPFAMLSGALAGLAATIHDVPIYYPGAGADVWLVYGIASVASGALVAGVGAWLLLRALVRTGVLREFAVGRDQHPV